MMEIRLIGTQIGAEVCGVDVKTMDEAAFARIYQAWLDYNVIAVRDQDLSMADYLAYSRRFGQVVAHPSKSTRFSEYPEITLLGANKFGPDGKLNMSIYKRGGEDFHTDGSYEKEPYKATQLYATAIPTIGGDTLFASTYAAYEALPQPLKQRLEGLYGAYIYGGPKRISIELLDEKDRNAAPVLHPLVRIHAETGRKALYFDPNKLLRIEGLTESESSALIAELRGYMVQPHAQYRHKWRKGDIVIWDNRCSYHKAAADYPPEQERIHWRVSIKEHVAAVSSKDRSAVAQHALS
jgi:taurine dioxygenase